MHVQLKNINSKQYYIYYMMHSRQTVKIDKAKCLAHNTKSSPMPQQRFFLT